MVSTHHTLNELRLLFQMPIGNLSVSGKSLKCLESVTRSVAQVVEGSLEFFAKITQRNERLIYIEGARTATMG